MSYELSEHKRRVAATYNLASAGYNQPALRFFTRCAHRLVDLIDVQPGQHVLDVATGTGAVAIDAAHRVSPTGRVVGVDIATDMLMQARLKSEAAHLTNIAFQEGDAEHLSFADRSFNAVTCAFGIFFLPEMESGPREWRRVVREAGVVAFSAFDESAFQPLSDLFEARIRSYGVSFPVPQRPFSWQRLTSLEHCRRLLQKAGLECIEERVEQLGYYLRTPQDWWEIVWNSGFRGSISQLSTDHLAHFRREHLAEVEQLMTEQGIWLDIATFFVWGYRPTIHQPEVEIVRAPASRLASVEQPRSEPDLAGAEQALARHTPEIHHSDQGVQYAALAYTARLHQSGCREVGQACQNGYAERLMHTILRGGS